MDNKKTAVGGLSFLGVLSFLIHILHGGFNIYEYSHKKDTIPDMETILDNSIIKKYEIKNLDSIITIEDKSLRDSLLKEALKQSARNNTGN